MKEAKLTITKSAFDNNTCSAIAACANRFAGTEITIYAGTRRVNAKSLMGIIGMALRRGVEVLVRVDGGDEDDALAALTSLLVE